MSFRPLPPANYRFVNADGTPAQYEYLFDLDRYVRGLTPGGGGGGDADTLNGHAGSYYLAWGNFTGVPSEFPPSAHNHPQSDVTDLVSDLADKQPLDSDLTAIAALTTTTYGRALLTQADASALRATAGLVIGTDVVAQSHVGSGGSAHANVVAGGAAGFMTGTDKTKLDGIASGATANSADATLLNRANHTGTQPASTITGTTTNDNAAAGRIGEIQTASVVSGSSISLTTNTDTNITSISLTAGDWDVDGVVYFVPQAGSTSITVASASISATSATRDITPGAFNNVPMLNSGSVLAGTFAAPLPPYRISLATTTTIYLVARSTFTVSSMNVYGRIAARRVR